MNCLIDPVYLCKLNFQMQINGKNKNLKSYISVVTISGRCLTVKAAPRPKNTTQ